MTFLKLTVDADFVLNLEEKLSNIQGIEIKEDILDECQALLLNRVRQRFLQQEAPDGSTWPISEAAKRRKGNGGTLFDKGNLFHSIQAALPTELERVIGTDVFYGPHHQFGTGKLPVREFLGYSDEDIFLIEKLTLRRLSESLQ